MDSFIYKGDYDTQIQGGNLTQITGNKQDVLDSAQLAAVEECKSYLVQKYDVSEAFNPISKHSEATTYLAGKTVYLTADAYTEKTYALGDQVLQDSNVYRCTTPIAAPEAFTIANWTLIAPEGTIYFAKYPKNRFNYKTIYAVGTEVFYKDKTYTCATATQILGHQELLQIGKTLDSPIVNVFPDDPTQGEKYWGTGTTYEVPTLTQINNPIFWVEDDNRDQKLLQVCIDIVLYHLHCRIAPNNVPDSRIIRYIGHGEDRETRGQRVLYPTYSALGWLQAAAIGNDITPSLPLLQPKSGGRIRHGGNTKLTNSY